MLTLKRIEYIINLQYDFQMVISDYIEFERENRKGDEWLLSKSNQKLRKYSKRFFCTKSPLRLSGQFDAKRELDKTMIIVE